ncbi:hypothetical protein L208DRAFT_1420412 [Tricholoma matsutake]|nr:hypothetical protein L208DRAFT_1420412 [Tricholoma matsutake 945]
MTSSKPTTGNATTGDDLDPDAIRGISDNKGDLAEQQGLAEKEKAVQYYGGRNNTGKAKIKLMAKIIPTTSKDKIQLSHLPLEIQQNYQTIFTPWLWEMFGGTQPWESPSKDDIHKLWSQIFDNGPALSQKMEFIVFKLVDDCLAEWQNKFASTALTYLKGHVFSSLPKNMKEARSIYAKWLVTGKDHERPFYYRVFEDGNGLFQSSLIAAMLGSHFSGISQIRARAHSKERPIGALVLSIQATNWGDCMEMREGKHFKIKTTSSLVKVVNELSDVQWDKIINTAISTSKQKNLNETIPVQVEEVLGSSAESDFELADDDEKEGAGLEEYNGDSLGSQATAMENRALDNMDVDTHLEGSK